ncbi:DNA-deoxyinosine glycosylase [Novosphingobium tardum]|uniref:DNA-deoxyinosine glycosylase n=1 Tax=Novosphingobium tardum TaxID=1538021 RepID=A0ABV8RRU9_9SPHN
MIAPDTQVIVLGSLPGRASLAADRYYAHPRNQFWRLIGSVIERDLVPLEYEDRLAALRDGGIGLWDTVASAERAGSLDTALRNVTRNPLADVLERAPKLRALGFNGGAAARIGRKALPSDTPLALIDLPSSSPAYCRISVDEKAQAWAQLREFLA